VFDSGWHVGLGPCGEVSKWLRRDRCRVGNLLLSVGTEIGMGFEVGEHVSNTPRVVDDLGKSKVVALTDKSGHYVVPTHQVTRQGKVLPVTDSVRLLE
jgi:hypothetical protein